MAQRTTIQVGDKFNRNGVTFEVIGTLPGGKVDLFDRANTRFVTKLHKEVKLWDRAA